MENEKKTFLQRFATLAWYEAFIEFVFRFVAKTSELLLALGLVSSAADVLSKGQLMENNPMLLYIWAWFQGVGIEASGGIVLVYGLKSVKQHDTIKAWMYLILASLLSIVGGVMLFTQLVASTTGTPEFGASGGVNAYVVIMSALRSIVSIGYVVMCRTKDIQFSGFTQDGQEVGQISAPIQPVITIEDIRAIVAETVTSVVTNITVQVAQVEQGDGQPTADEQLQIPEHSAQTRNNGKLSDGETNENFLRVREFIEANPKAKVREVAVALEISPSTAGKWMQKARQQG